jgi:quinol monooxygenase YgiN
MVIVQGTGRVDSELRERFLAQRAELMKISRAEPGNLEYVFAADPIEADRVILSERWETQEDLTAHLRAAAGRRRHAASDEGSQVSVDFDIAVYEVGSAKPLT